MKIKITALSNNIYQFADKTISDNSTGTWRGRIVNAPDISRSFSDLGSVASTLYIQLINYDLQIPLTEDLWNASIDVETDNGYKWSGKVSAYETNADGKMYITATETTAPEYSRYIPDEFARLVSIDEDVHMSALNVTIPTVIGGNANNPIPVKGILKSKSDAIYYLCIGEIHDIVKVRVGDKTMTRAEAAEQGYICYTGSANQTDEPGIAYIQITDTSKRLNDDGSYVDIGAEVIGLKLGNHTVEECRNGARFLYWLLKTPSTGVCGWGLGISTNDIDTTSFETAITYVDLIGLKLDGVMYDNRSAQNWIDEICRAIRGTYEIGTDGKRRLSIDVASTSSYTYTKDNIELVRFGAGAFTGRVYNKGTLDYCYNPITGMFMQTSQYQNAESIARIDEQLFEGESYLIRDAETAQKIVEYTCKKSLVEANKILFNTRFLPENCRIGTVITINYPEKGMNNSLFKITSLQIGDHINRIEAVKYDENIYTSGQVSTTIAWQNEEPILSSVSAPSIDDDFLTLATTFDILPDGTGVTSITGSFTMPNGKYLTAVVEYGEGSSPATWYSLGMLKDNSFRISPLKVYTIYSVRIRLVSSNGHSNFIVKTIRTAQDSEAPGTPTVTLSAMLRTVSVYCKLNNNPPDDMGGFVIYRKLSSGSAYEVVGIVAATKSKDDQGNYIGEAVYADVVDDYQTYMYQAKSYDKSGNLSAASTAVSISVIPAESGDISSAALSMPQGSMLRISAKGSTSTSILATSGIRDVSGYNKHGKATGSYIQIVDDTEKGKVIKKAAHASAHNITMQSYNISGAITYTFWVKWDTTATAAQQIIRHYADATNGGIIVQLTKSAITVNYYASGATQWSQAVSISTTSGKWFQVAVILSTTNLKVFVNGALKYSNTSQKLIATHSSIPLYLLYTNAANSGFWYLHDFRIYSRELTNTQVKTLYMFPEDVIFGEITADNINTNTLTVGQGIIVPNNSILTAMINDLGVTTGKIADLAVTTAKIANLAVTNAKIANSTIQRGKFDVTNAVFVKSGSTAAAGIVPSPGTTAGTTKMLCEDGTWKVPPTAAACSGNAATATSAAACTGNAATATTATNSNNVKTTVASGAWKDVIGVDTGFTSAANKAVYGHNSGSLSFYVDANATSGNQRAILRLGNATANTTAAGHNGALWLYGTGTTYIDFRSNAGANKVVTIKTTGGTSREYTLPDKAGTFAMTADIPTVLNGDFVKIQDTTTSNVRLVIFKHKETSFRLGFIIPTFTSASAGRTVNFTFTEAFTNLNAIYSGANGSAYCQITNSSRVAGNNCYTTGSAYYGAQQTKLSLTSIEYKDDSMLYGAILFGF